MDDGTPAPAAPAERAQALRCGELGIALLHGWARAAIERFELSAVPQAPAWLAGATNVEGQVVPVIDLLQWLDPAQAIDPTDRDARLLVGGDGQTRVALLFQGLPRLTRVQRQAATQAPERLAPFVIGMADDIVATGPTWALDAPALVQALAAELALH
jgi:chemotaxis signal transduction protein